MAFNTDVDKVMKGRLFETSGAVQTLLGQPGLGNDTSLQLKGELADRKKKLLNGAAESDQTNYGVGSLLSRAGQMLFGQTK